MSQDTLSTSGLFEPGRSGLRLDDYDYPLPESLIARYPLDRRDQSRMLVMDRAAGTLAHRHFYELPEFLRPGDLVVLNNTKVLPARFYGNRRGFTGRVEVLLLHPSAEDDGIWSALMKPARKLGGGTIVELPGTEAVMEVLEVGERGCCRVKIHPAEHGDVPTLMERVGRMPIPPYLRREAEESDKDRYQTVFSRVPGAQAAPTAGLHFTPEVLERLKARGVEIAEVTLAVSAGTFRTVEVEDIAEHRMDPEYYTVPPETLEAVHAAKERGGRVVAIGTTVCKTLESAACARGRIQAGSDWSRLFIYPGFTFQVTDALLTNFHLPKSTLLMLVSAFSSREQLAQAYRAALEEEYRFFSYGDCMLVV